MASSFKSSIHISNRINLVGIGEYEDYNKSLLLFALRQPVFSDKEGAFGYGGFIELSWQTAVDRDPSRNTVNPLKTYLKYFAP